MNDRDEHDRNEGAQPETEVPGVQTHPDDDKKTIEVDTNERLEHKDKHLDDIPDDELEQEREERLDPENRPENAEVDNSDRTFDSETGLFEDSDVEAPEGAPFATTEAEQSQAEPKDREDATDAEQSKEAKESKDTEG